MYGLVAEPLPEITKVLDFRVMYGRTPRVLLTNRLSSKRPTGLTVTTRDIDNV